MAEKKSEKKFLALLLVLVVLSLVVDLLSLNVLYNIAGDSGLKGGLFSTLYYPRNEPTQYYTDYSDSPDYSSGETEEFADSISYYRDETSDIGYEESYGCSIAVTSINDAFPCIGDCTYDLSVCNYRTCVAGGICKEGCDLDQGCVLNCVWEKEERYQGCEDDSENCLMKC